MSWIKGKVVLLPTKEKSNIFRDCEENELIYSNELSFGGGISCAKHIYITIDEEIKDGDWVLETLNNVIFQVKTNGNDYKNSTFKKIIAATDISLTENIEMMGTGSAYIFQLPQPSSEFIQKYIKAYNEGNKIEEVMVEYEVKGYIKHMNPEEKSPTKHHHYWIENIVVKINKDNTINIKSIKDSWNLNEIINALHKVELLHNKNYSTIWNNFEQQLINI